MRVTKPAEPKHTAKDASRSTLKIGEVAKLSGVGIETLRFYERSGVLGRPGRTPMFVSLDGKVAGLLSVADPIKESTPEAIRQLHEDGIRIVMLTGDSRTTANAVAARLNIDEVVAEVLPNQKAEIVKRYQSQGHKVAMAGDGINDAPALAQADVGIAHGDRNRCCDRECRRYPSERRSERHRESTTVKPGYHEQHQAEPLLCLCL